MSNGRVINVRDAQIKTAKVEIKSLTVSGKQVTMGVFRQLIKEPVIDPETFELRGLPWGTVNYFPKPCTPNHLHVVWQKGTELRRACVPELWDLDLAIDEVQPVGGAWSMRGMLKTFCEEDGLADYRPVAMRLMNRRREWDDRASKYEVWGDEQVYAYRAHYEELESLDQLFIAV
jgi:hypothetical protein